MTLQVKALSQMERLKELLSTGFEPRYSGGVKSDPSVNCATTTALDGLQTSMIDVISATTFDQCIIGR